MTALRRRILVVIVSVAAVAAVLTLGGSQREGELPYYAAADLSQFQAGNIISDEVFFSGSAMSVTDIQLFLNAKNGGCVTGTDGTPCLRNFRQDTTTRAPDAYCNGYGAAPGEAAATILAKVAVSCNVSPKVLLVMLEKEQGLLSRSGSTLTANRYQKAMGYACPDTPAGCDAAYYGFQNQVYSAARQYQRYAANPTGWQYRAGRTVNIQWSPDVNCGSSPVYIANQATAGLYIYTPYQPNAAALNAGYGSGDACSAYGNRNFWLLFTDWFGSTQSDAVTAATPRGVVDSLAMTPSGFTASGWSYDPDAPNSPVNVSATVDGTVVASTTAAGSRPDVGNAFGIGANHGFSVSGFLRYGSHRVCLVADNLAGQGVAFQFGCRSVTFTDQVPVMGLDTFAEQPDGSVLISGWVFDPDGTAPQMHVYVNGKGTAYSPNLPRPDVRIPYPKAGPNSGFSITVGPLTGSTQVCLYAVDTVAPGNNSLSGCPTFEYRSPFGFVDDASQTADGSLHVAGWLIDPSTPSTPSQVHVYVDGHGTALPANISRPDIAQAFPGAGAAHGFDAVVPAGAGAHQVCLFGINLGVAGVNPILSCSTITFSYTAPRGVVDSVSPIGDGKVWVGGWAQDPDVPMAPVSVHHYVDDRWFGAFTAADNRPDIAAAFPGAGPAHGFGTVLDLGAGTHKVCTFAINLGVAGTNPFMGCQTVNVFDRAPMGSFDVADVSSPGQLSVAGWTFDPDALTATANVQVSVDGVSRGTFPANASRPDVGAVYPTAGAQHGFALNMPITAGAHDVCVSALSTAKAATPSLLRCIRVTS
jgi:hypothetical protein